MKKIKAIILAAGKGNRLMPLTSDKPKIMVDLLGMTILERQIRIYNSCGINEIIVVTGYKSQNVIFPNIKKLKNEKYDSTNMVETLFCAEKEFDETIIVSYGDIIFEKSVLEKLVKSKEDISVVIDKNWRKFWNLRFDNPLDDAESLKIDSLNNILEIGKRVKSEDEIQGQYIGLMKFNKKGIKIIKKFYHKTRSEYENTGKNLLNSKLSFEKSFMTDFLEGLIKFGTEIKAIPIKGGWLELDNLKDFEKYNEIYVNKKITDFIKLED